jgi:hypothetical protein
MNTRNARSHLPQRLAVALAVVCLVAPPAPAAAVRAVPVAVFPFSSVSLEQKDLLVIAEALRRDLRLASFQVLDVTETMMALKSVGCESSGAWNRESCIRTAGRAVGAGYVIGGTLNAIGSLYEATVVLYSVRSAARLWSATYEIHGPIESFYKEAPAKIAAEVPREVVDEAAEPPPAPVAPHVHAMQRGQMPQTTDVEAPAAQAPPPNAAVEARDNGISPGLAIGLSALFSLGPVEGSQSPYGVRIWGLYPTSRNSQVRLRVALPLTNNSHLALTPDRDYKCPDVNVNIEHEWGLPGFGVGLGLGYMVMQAFAVEGEYESYTYYGGYDTTDYQAVYDQSHALNMVFNIRGGKPNAAFFARFSWPLPYIFGDDQPDNYYLEYSAFGVFGGRRVKAGIGVAGMYKHREADYVSDGDSTYHYEKDGGDWSSTNYYNEYAQRNTSEWYALVPAVKVAGLIGTHVVVNLCLELGGTILPRIGGHNDSDWWRPSLGFDVLYSIGKLKGASVMDGTF